MKIILAGISGAMGNVIADSFRDEIVCGIDLKKHPEIATYSNFSEIPENIEADVVIDFSHPSLLGDSLEYATINKLPLVIATTGLSKKQEEEIKKASVKIPILYASNMSLGINTLLNILPDLSEKLIDFDTEIMETHHNKKKDAPSGTALSLAKSLNKPFKFNREGERIEGETGIVSLRGGTVPGEHSIFFFGEDEIIEVKHTALSKKIFANGAYKGAEWLINQTPGNYNYQDVLK